MLLLECNNADNVVRQAHHEREDKYLCSSWPGRRLLTLIL